MPVAFKIENKPVPPRLEHQFYPLESLKVGQSFFVPLAEPSPKNIARVRAAVRYWLLAHPDHKGKYRVIKDAKGIRIGRTA